MKIESSALTTCEVSPDGKAVSLGFVDSDGCPAAVRLPLDQVGALAMTLPGLIEQALRVQFSDNSLRYTYPLSSWKLERSSDQANSIVTLRTDDGFSVCFSMRGSQREAFLEALEDAVPAPSGPRAN